MTASISITDPAQAVKWGMEINLKEYDQLVQHCKDTPRFRDWMFGAVIPIRLNENFWKDFFLPTFVNNLPEVENGALQTLVKVAILFFDIVTLPIRAITALPWAGYVFLRGEHPVHKFLREKGASFFILNQEWVNISLEKRLPGDNESSWHTEIDKTGQVIKRVHEKIYFYEKSLNFIDVPFHPSEETDGSRG